MNFKKILGNNGRSITIVELLTRIMNWNRWRSGVEIKKKKEKKKAIHFESEPVRTEKLEPRRRLGAVLQWQATGTPKPHPHHFPVAQWGASIASFPCHLLQSIETFKDTANTSAILVQSSLRTPAALIPPSIVTIPHSAIIWFRIRVVASNGR